MLKVLVIFKIVLVSVHGEKHNSKACYQQRSGQRHEIAEEYFPKKPFDYDSSVILYSPIFLL